MRRGSRHANAGTILIGSLSIVLVAAACGAASPKRSSADSGTLLNAATAPPAGADTSQAASSVMFGWREALADPRHSSSSNAVGPTSGRLAWRRSLGAPVVAGAVAGLDGTIYESANNGVLHALDPASGQDRWVFNPGGSTDNNDDLSTSAAIAPDGTVLWPAPGGHLDAISLQGRLEWSIALRGFVLSPVVEAGHVYVTDSQGDLASLSVSPKGGTLRWQLKLGKVSFGSAAVGDNGVVYATVDNRLVAVKDSGTHAQTLWIFEPHSTIEVSPSVAPDGTIVLGTNDGFEYGLRSTGSVRWRYPLGHGIFSYSTPAVTADGLSYFGDNNGDVDVVRAETGTVIGRYRAPSKSLSSNGVGVWTSPAIDRNHDVYFGTASGHIFGYRYDGKQLFDHPTGAIVASYPSIVGEGLLVIGSDDGSLYAFRN